MAISRWADNMRPSKKTLERALVEASNDMMTGALQLNLASAEFQVLEKIRLAVKTSDQAVVLSKAASRTLAALKR